MQTSRLLVVYGVLNLGLKMAEMGQKTDGGFGTLAGFLEEKAEAGIGVRQGESKRDDCWS